MSHARPAPIRPGCGLQELSTMASSFRMGARAGACRSRLCSRLLELGRSDSVQRRSVAVQHGSDLLAEGVQLFVELVERRVHRSELRGAARVPCERAGQAARRELYGQHRAGRVRRSSGVRTAPLGQLRNVPDVLRSEQFEPGLFERGRVHVSPRWTGAGRPPRRRMRPATGPGRGLGTGCRWFPRGGGGLNGCGRCGRRCGNHPGGRVLTGLVFALNGRG